jgi:peptide/nickel transport system substrate-binding protein
MLLNLSFRKLANGSQRWFHRPVIFGILGPIEVIAEGRPLSLGGPRQRALLAFLLLHGNEVVSRDRLIDAVWGDRLPESPGQALDTYISRLRRLLGSERLQRRDAGYLLRVEPGELDLDRFQELTTAHRFREALELWRGPALADVRLEPGFELEAERLEEQRLTALEERIDADLAAGAGAELVAELERLVREHPLRERLLAASMLALYRAGRQAAALEAYRGARRRLAAELGLEPGPQLKELERRILEQDPRLAAPQRRAAASARERGRRRLGFVVAALAVAAAAASTLFLVLRPSVHANNGSDAGSRLLSLSSGSGRLGATAALPGEPASIARSGGSLWLTDPADGLVLRADPASSEVVDRIAVGGQPGSIVTGGGAVWAAGTIGSTVTRIDPASGTAVQRIPLGGGDVAAVAYGRGELWVADSSDDALVAIDPRTGGAARTFTLGLRPTALAVGESAVWVADHDSGLVAEVDPKSGQTLATIAVGNGPAALALSHGVLWVANSLDSTVSAIDVETDRVVATVPVGSDPTALAATGGSVWVANRYSRTISRIDASTRTVTATIATGGEPDAIAAAGPDVWLADGPGPGAHRGGTLRLVGTRPYTTLDPGIEFVFGFQLARFTYDTLVTFAASSGPAGLQLVPDLALALPAPSDGGTTYTFRLRPGIRYSDGRPVRAEDFRRAIERQFRVGGPVTDYFSGVVGAASCSVRRCDLSRGIRVDDRRRTVTFHLVAPDPDFLFKLTVGGFSAPIPPGTPDRDQRLHPIPGTGPYRVAAASRHSVRFVRNPYFHEWSHAAQPDGNPDQIVWEFTRSPAAAVRRVEQGLADWSFTLTPAQLRVNSTFGVEFVPLNTHRPPFDHLRVRRALNYAIDRGKIARMYGPLLAIPLCQPLAPGFTAFRRYCPYTRDPRADGTWSAPDLAEARRLVAASGTRGQHVTVWGSPDEGLIPRGLPAYIASVLRELGYRTTLHLVPFASMTPAIWRRIQISVDGDWLPDYPTPSSYVPGFFACSGGLSNGYVCDRPLDRQMSRATALQLRNPQKANALWTHVDHELVDRAYWAPMVNLGTAELVSKRLRNYQFNPLGGFIADQAWLR